MLPKQGNLTQNAWTGAGYLAVGVNPVGTAEITYGISSNLKGGYTDDSLLPQFVPLPVEQTSIIVSPLPAWLSLEPIDLATGAYLYDHQDIAVGAGGAPSGLALQRSYSSQNRYTNGSLGLGWSHNFAISATLNSDGLKGLGQDSPIDGAAAIVEAYVSQDLLSDASKPLNKLVIATLAQRWFMDQLINNTVNIAVGSQGEQFVRLADGSYNAQLGSTNRLSLANGAYTLTQKDGTTLGFNTAGNIASWRSPAGTAVSFTYDAASPPKLTKVENNLGQRLNFGYSGSQLTQVTDTVGRSVNYAYDGAGNLTSFADPAGAVTRFAYSTPGLLTQIFYPSNPDTAFVTNTYDSLGRVMAQSNANNAPGNDTTWTYYFAGYRSEEVDAFGTQHVLYWNPRGRAQFEIQDAASLNLVTKTVYDGLDRPTSVTLPEGNYVAYTYDAANPWANNVASVTRNPKSGSGLSATTTMFTYNPTWNKPANITDARGMVSTFLYDAQGNLARVMADAGGFNATSAFTYDAFGRVATATDPVGTVTKNNYGSDGNPASVVADYGPGRLNLTTSFTWDTIGNLTSATDPRGNTSTMTYDAARRLLTTTGPPPFNTGPQLVRTSNAYDADGRVTSVTRANGASTQVASTAYTRTGKTASVTDPNGNTTRYTYDRNDRLASVVQPVASGITRTTRTTYDALGRVASVIDPAGNTTEQYSYTANGQVQSFTDARGNITRYTYDGFDRLSQTTYAYGTGLASSESLTYDANDNVLTRTNRAGGTIAFTYDTLNRLSTKSPPASAPVVTYTYDLAGRVKGVSDTSSSITAAVPPSGTSVTYSTTATYDQLNRPGGFTWTNVPSATTPSAASVTFTHGYNQSNQRVNQGVTDSTWWFYPTSAASTSYTANALNQYTAVGAVTPTYDSNGNLTYDGTFTFGYDAENRLTSASGAGNTVSYAYDAQGRRKSKTVNGTTTVYVTDADNREVLEYAGSGGAVQAWYAYGMGSNEVLNRMDVPGGTRQTFVPDIQGSTVATLDSGGTLTKRGYWPYGEGSTSSGTFAYTGLRIDPETAGLQYARARMYMPAWGRFLQPDPIGYTGGRNLYTYANNQPLNFVDVSGESPYNVLGALGGGVTGAVGGMAVGYQTGGRFGAAVGMVTGGVTGAAVGAILPSAAPTVAVLAAGAAASLSQQGLANIANLVAGRTIEDVNLKQIAFSSFGGAAFLRAVPIVRGMVSAPVVAAQTAARMAAPRAISTSSVPVGVAVSPVLEEFVGSAASATGAALGELGSAQGAAPASISFPQGSSSSFGSCNHIPCAGYTGFPNAGTTPGK